MPVQRSMFGLRLLALVGAALALAAVADALPAQGWVDRTGPNGPAPRGGHAMCYDPVRGYVLMVGQHPAAGGSGTVAETWSWNGTAWTLRGPAPQAMTHTPYGPYNFPSAYALAVHAATNEVLLAVDSSTAATAGPAVVYRWDGAAWTQVASGLTPTMDTSLGFACDPTRNQTVLFSASSPNHVMVYDGVAWSTRPVTSPPTIGSGAQTVAMAFDAVVGKVVLATVGMVWEWNGLGWNQRILATPITQFAAAAASNDALRNRIVAWGASFAANSQVGGQTWLYGNAVVTPLAFAVEPSMRSSTAMAYDPVRDVHVLFGGSMYLGLFPAALFGDTWEFHLGPLASVTPYGAGCAGSRGVPQLAALGGSLPRVGQTFTTRTTNLPLGGPVFQLLGVSDVDYGGTPLPLDLTLLGAPGCLLRTSIEAVQTVQNVFGNATWSIAIPPVLGATFYVQTLPFDPAANASGLTFSNGARAVVGL